MATGCQLFLLTLPSLTQIYLPYRDIIQKGDKKDRLEDIHQGEGVILEGFAGDKVRIYETIQRSIQRSIHRAMIRIDQ
jgi:hypothetical protein